MKKSVSKGAVIVVDMIEAFYRIGYLQNPRVAGIVQSIKDLLKEKTGEGWKVIFLGDQHEEHDAEFKMFPPHAVVPEERAVIKELQGFLTGKNFIAKTRYSGFYGTDLEKVLEDMNPEKVVVVGVCTDICVHYTVADLRNRGYEVTVPQDCVETFDVPCAHSAAKANENAIYQMENILGAKIVETWEDI